jgi:NTE family protein
VTHAKPTLKEWLAQEPFTLTLSSGFFGFFAHGGVVSALLDAGLMPKRATGSSAGALSSAALACGMDPDAIKRELTQLKKEHFWDPAFGFGLLRGKLFHDRLVDTLGARDLGDLKIPVALSVYDVFGFKTRVVTKGPLAAAVCASCAVPVMFHPVRVEERWCVDGGVLDRPGFASVAKGERVLFHHLTRNARYKRGEVPIAENRVGLALDNMPRPLPDELEKGPRAFDTARKLMERALASPAEDLIVQEA